MPYTKPLSDLTTTTTQLRSKHLDTTITIWTIPQFEQCQTTFSHALAHLQREHDLISASASPSSITPQLLTSLIRMTQAMTVFLQRRYAMNQRLQGLGRVVESESSRTWYAQPDSCWLRKACADLRAKCDAFVWVVGGICEVAEKTKRTREDVVQVVCESGYGQSRPVLRSYNSFSSLGSEDVHCNKRRHANANPEPSPSLSSPGSNPFSDGSSVYSTSVFSTGQSSTNGGSPTDHCHWRQLHVDKCCGKVEESPNSAGYMSPEVLREFMALATRHYRP